MAGFLLSLVIAFAGSGSVTPRCDLVEINHYLPVDGDGFVQLIAWDWCHRYKRWQVQQRAIVTAWSVNDRLVICDNDGLPLRVAFRLFRETWTRKDPERLNQFLFPANERRRVW